MDRVTIKKEAKAAIKNSWLMLFVVVIIIAAISTFTLGLAAPVLAAGLYYISLDLLRGKDIDANHFMKPFRNLNHVLKLIATSLLVSLIVALGTFLFVIPGIIFSLRYSQALYIMIEDPEISVMDALRKSEEMMQGHKVEFFIFQLSFLGHLILVALTFGIYGAYVITYQIVAFANYYVHLKGDARLNDDVIDV